MLGSRLAPVAATVCSPYLSCVRFKRSAAKSGRVSAASGSDRSAALMMAIRQIESSFGKGAVMQLGSTKTAERVEVISSGSLSLDLALVPVVSLGGACNEAGGLEIGLQLLTFLSLARRVVEIYGPESSGKTTLALSCIAEAQKTEGGVCAFIDAEHAIDAHYAKALGVDIDALYVSQPDSGEEALEIADTLIRSGAVDLVVLDSVAALVPRAELEGEMGDQQIALQARLMSQALRKLTGSLSKSNCTIIFLNQIRQKVGIIFGSPEVTSGGTALRYYASVDCGQSGQEQVGFSFKVANFDMMFGRGIDRQSELLDLGVQHGLLKRSGAWYSLAGSDEPIAQGKAKAKVFLQENPEIAKDLEAKLRQMLFEPAEADEKVDEASVGADSEIADEDNATSTAEVGEAGTGETITG
ncbi:P-loop containing nucleoside triphosphate hydrolase [Phytophthora cactorum]|nr:P-loop containing nucleoside triphosphate hydrolase [Phytophthora cactorum]